MTAGTAAWTPCDSDYYFDELVPYVCGKWSERAAIHHLRFCANELNRGKNGENGRPWPSRADLAALWSWSDRQVRALLVRDDEWRVHVAFKPVPREQLVAPRTPGAIQVATKCDPSAIQVDTDERQESAASVPSAIQVRSKSRPSRDPLLEPDQPVNQELVGDVQVAWNAIVALAPHQASRNGRPQKARAEALHARIDEEGVDAVLAVIEYVHRKPHRDQFWGPKNEDPSSYLRPSHFPEVLGRARKSGAASTMGSGPKRWMLNTTTDVDAALLNGLGAFLAERKEARNGDRLLIEQDFAREVGGPLGTFDDVYATWNRRTPRV